MKYPSYKIYSHLRYSVLIWICTVIGSSTTFAQNIYKIWWNGTSRELVQFDMTLCESQVLKNLADDRELGVYGALEMSFHPDGYLYFTTFTDTHDVYKIFRYQPNSQRIEEFTTLDLPNPAHQIAITEEGNAILSSGNSSDATLIYEYNLRKREIVREIDLPGLPTIAKNIYGVVKDNNLLFGTATDQHTTGIWYMDTKEFDSTTFRSDQYYNLSHPTIYYPACGRWQLISSQALDRNRKEHLVVMDTTAKTIEEWCAGFSFYNYNNGTATTTDFRQSSLRIDLDADNSSGHITAGYYDTLTTCRKFAPIADEDIDIFSCGTEVDFISFRLKYFDQPRLPEEYITAEGFEDQLKQTSPSRWVWENPFGNDTARIKDFLRSVRYHADWQNPDERERAVAVTMHVGDDSTSSWSLYQLDRGDVYAGEDTTIAACPGVTEIDLADYLSQDLSPDGRLEPVPTGGGTVIYPSVDQEEEYLYILEKAECTDTAVLRINYKEAPEDPDTVVVCPGEGLWYNLPPASYSEIIWWDGSHEDSIWIEVSRDTVFYVETVLEDSCTWVLKVPVRVGDVTGLAGEDQTVTFCAGDPEVDLNAFLPAVSGMDRRLKPVLSGEDLIFRPGDDAAGEYQYILSVGSCADTAMITFQESPEQELSLDDIQLCEEQEIKIGLPPDTYQSITWWNGMSGDSTTIHSSDTGPFTVEAQSEGCTYRGTFQVFVRENIEFPESYPDTLKICPGDRREITIQELDSIQQQGNTYLHGDQILFSQPGDYVLTGYTGGCSTSKTITVACLPDPSNGYSETVYWCERTPLSLSLPNDSAGLSFSWSDGLTVRERPVTATGEYRFDIQSGNCTFQSKYTVLANDESECDREECSVSIPNAITPNGDGWNDELKIFLSPECGSVESVTLWDKWGGLRYQTNLPYLDASVCEKLPAGTYLVQVSYVDELGQNNTVTESVLVIR